jgi:hypothetical protein
MKCHREGKPRIFSRFQTRLIGTDEHRPRTPRRPRGEDWTAPLDDFEATLKPDNATTYDLDTSSKEQTKPDPHLVEKTKPVQEQDGVPVSQSRERIPDGQEEDHAPTDRQLSAPLPAEEDSHIPRGHDAPAPPVVVREPMSSAATMSTDTMTTSSQTDTENSSDTSRQLQLLAEYGKAQNRPNLVVDFHTPHGQRQLLAFLQDFASWWASNGGSMQRGNLGLEMPDLAGLLFPQHEGLITMIMSKQSTKVPQPIRQRLDEIFSEGMLFWYRTSEYAMNPKEELGDKCGLTAHGKALSGWRICLVQKVLPNAVLVTWGWTHRDNDLGKIHRGNHWQSMRLLRHDGQGWPQDISIKDSPHENIFMYPKIGEGWSEQGLKPHCNFNVLVANEVIPAVGFEFAGRLTRDSLDQVRYVRDVFYVGLEGLKYMPSAPNGVDMDAVRRGMENMRKPRHEPSAPVKPKLFPAADQMSSLPPYVPTPAGVVSAFGDPPTPPHIPTGPRFTGGRRPGRFERSYDRHRGRSSSPPYRERQDERERHYTRGDYRDRSGQRNQRNRQLGSYERTPEPPPGGYFNFPTVITGDHNNVQGGRYQHHAYRYEAPIDNNRGRDRSHDRGYGEEADGGGGGEYRPGDDLPY